MIWMGILMGLPVLGLALFLVYPWQVALPPYLILTGASLFFDWLMMGAMHLPVRSGREAMIGSGTSLRAGRSAENGKSGVAIGNAMSSDQNTPA